MTKTRFALAAGLSLAAMLATPAGAEKKKAAAETPPANCAVPAAGKLPATKKVSKKDRGRFSIDDAPRISVLSATEICTNNAKMREVKASDTGALGLSSQVMNTRAGRMDLMALPAVEAELQKVLVSFARAWPYQQLPATPRILFRASDAYDAYALPDNTIVMSLGTLEAAQSDSEVLFVLAHEYAHLLMGHYLKVENISGAKGAVKALSSVYQAGAYMSQLRTNAASGSLSLTAADQQKLNVAAKRASVVSSALSFAIDDIFSPAWNRDQENEADALAIDLLVASNQTIDSYATVFERLQKAFEAQKASREKRSEVADSLNKSLEASLKEINASSFASKMGTSGGMKSMGVGFATNLGLGLAAGVGKSMAGDSHLPPEDRRKGLAAYFQAGYPEADPPIDTGAMVKRMRAIPEYRGAVSLKTNYIAARAQYGALNFSGALGGLRKLGAGSRSAPTFVNYLAALTARDSGDHALARTYFDAGRTGGGVPNVQLYESYAEMRIGDRDAQQAGAILDDGARRFGDPDHFKSFEIRRDVAMGDMSGAQTTYTACMAVKGRDYIPERCKAVMPESTTQKSNPFGIKLPFGG